MPAAVLCARAGLVHEAARRVRVVVLEVPGHDPHAPRRAHATGAVRPGGTHPRAMKRFIFIRRFVYFAERDSE